jgi:cysteine synthase
MREGILSAIGRTPLVRVTCVFTDINFHLFAKLEALNPGGSAKDRPAASIISHGIERGAIRPDAVVIESSSGNMGIGLAQVCSYFGLRSICVVDSKTTSQNIRLLKAYGAEVDVVIEPDPATGEFLHISDMECVIGCHQLALQESILAGGSSGAVIMAVDLVKEEISPDSNCVVILPDRGERYLDTIYPSSWVEEHFGDISPKWLRTYLKTLTSHNMLWL